MSCTMKGIILVRPKPYLISLTTISHDCTHIAWLYACCSFGHLGTGVSQGCSNNKSWHEFSQLSPEIWTDYGAHCLPMTPIRIPTSLVSPSTEIHTENNGNDKEME